jgi:iron only hydrogenase large subunit-like protein
MTRPHPIHVESATCRDCYKCVRHCPMKAVEIRNHAAAILPDRCIACGACVSVCPVHAKKVRDDIGLAKRLIETKKKVIVSLAPSALAAFDVDAFRLIRAFKQLGFFGVSETALGAEAVSFATYQKMAGRKNGAGFGLMLSSACPAAVALVRRKYSFLDEKTALMDSPMTAHGKLLRRAFGEDIGVVFVGPCIAKKIEADKSGGVIDAALTFEEIRKWLDAAQMSFEKMSEAPDESFLLGQATDGVLYPIEGGMIESLRAWGETGGVEMMSFSGIDAVTRALSSPEIAKADGLFLELLCCEGGCVGGPKGTETPGSTVLERLKVRKIRAERPKRASKERAALSASENFVPARVAAPKIQDRVTEAQIKEALKQIGKKSFDDELNCGGCGYDSCRDLARALVDGRAEKEMCVSHMRRLAMNKASALMAAMPSGVVILDRDLCIVECNRRFAEILGEDTLTVYETLAGLSGAHISKVFSVPNIFDDFLVSSEPFFEKEISMENKIVHVSLFDIEGKEIIGAILQDITSPAGRRHRIVKNAEEAIRKNLATAQQIACLLGENAAETEVLLQSIVRSFSMGQGDD